MSFTLPQYTAPDFSEARFVNAPDATYIDTSDLTIEQVCEIIIRKIHN